MAIRFCEATGVDCVAEVFAMSPDALNSLFSLCIGFALAGALSTLLGCGGGAAESNKSTTPAAGATDAAAAAPADGGAAPAPATP